MSVLKRRCLILSVMLVAHHSISWAGPYFNTYQTELDTLSRNAVEKLNSARISVINMFTALDAGKQDVAENERKNALESLGLAQKMFQEIASKVGNRDLTLKPSTDDEKLVLAQFQAALERHKLPFPKSERDLAALAVTVVGDYAQTVTKADLKGFPRNWKGSREIILSEIDLLYVGNLASIVWVISKENS